VRTLRIACAASVLAALSLEGAASCGAAFCLIDTDWSAQGAWTGQGLRFDLRFESVDLDQPRSGRDRVAVGKIPRHHDEVETRNRNGVAGFDWGITPEWGVSATLPFVDRRHVHIHNHLGAQLLETWDFREIGDVRVLARRELGASRDDPHRVSSWGVLAGVKLPTGKHDVTNGEGEEAERTLQPGTGTTDAIVGLYLNGVAPMADASWFARVVAVLPANEKAGYRPGRSLQLDAGGRYSLARDVGLMLQANYAVKARDRGVNAEPEDSGQRQLWVSPGISWNVGKHLQLYAFVQLPAYQSVNGVQLTARRAYLAGLSSRF
jgi:hypothetical protein